MKRLLYAFSLLAFLLISGVACNKSDKRTSLTQRLARGESLYSNIVDSSFGQQDINNSGRYGFITAKAGWAPQTFWDAVAGLMSATLTRSEIGQISPTAGNQTGVQFQGAVSATITGGGITRMDLSTAQLLIRIWDDKAGQEGPDGGIIPEYPLHFYGATGSASGNQVTITFSDAFGTLELRGYLNGVVFEGDMYYNNLISVDNSTPRLQQVGELGRFVINQCDFFICN